MMDNSSSDVDPPPPREDNPAGTQKTAGDNPEVKDTVESDAVPAVPSPQTVQDSSENNTGNSDNSIQPQPEKDTKTVSGDTEHSGEDNDRVKNDDSKLPTPHSQDNKESESTGPEVVGEHVDAGMTAQTPSSETNPEQSAEKNLEPSADKPQPENVTVTPSLPSEPVSRQNHNESNPKSESEAAKEDGVPNGSKDKQGKAGDSSPLTPSAADNVHILEPSEQHDRPHGNAATPRFVYILSALATIGGFLFGYDIGIVAGSMLFIQPYFELSTFWQEAVVSGTIAAAAVASLITGWLTDKIGRKFTIMTSGLVFTAGGILMGAAPTKEVLLIGRVVAGLGVGMASVVVPIYVAEASPVHIRGRLVSLHQLLINTGIITSSILAGGFSYVKPEGWRYMLGLAAVPGALQFVGFLFMPESPRWLVSKGHIERAKQVLLRMRAGNDVTEELNDIIATVEGAQKESAEGFQLWIKIFTTPHVRRSLFVGCALLFFQQWCGINTVIYYSGTVLKMAGFPVKYAIWLVTVPNLINFASSFIGLYLVEKIGRRHLLIVSLAGTIIGLIILAVGFQLAAENPPSMNTNIVETFDNGTVIQECMYKTCQACVKDNDCGYCYSSETDGTCLPSTQEIHSSAGRCNESDSTETHFKWAYEYCPSDYTWIALVGMAVFVFAFAPGLGPMPWTINSEIYPLWARSTCNSLAACTAWVCNLIISFTFLTMTEHITIYGTFWLFAAITVLGVIFMVIMLPETMHKTLEEMELLFMSKKHREQLANSKAKSSDSSSNTKL